MEGPMNRWHRILIACSAALLVTACGEAARSPLEPDQMEVRKTGQHSSGGNDVAPDSTFTVQSTSSEDPTPLENPDGTTRTGQHSSGGN
jgi:hypothetical protein